ncbi:MAG: hypothetical protein EOO82_02725 [Oxalobacteraceae bacterium]|nr:MAG: hypothetical protein EOO82_02725 [Oxalobacteraceae bacterium]
MPSSGLTGGIFCRLYWTLRRFGPKSISAVREAAYEELSMLRIAATALFALALVAPTLASEEDVYANIEAIHGNADGFFEIFSGVQDAAMFNPVDIAGYALYPITINANGETYDILDQQDFVDNFDSLILQETIDAIANQDVDDLIVTSEGVGVGNGVLWITNICLDDACNDTQWGVFSINN